MFKFTVKARHLKAAMLFQGKNDVRYYLNGIYLNKEKGRMEAANGHCMITIGSEDISSIHESMIISISGAIPSKAFYADVTMIDANCGVIEFRDALRNPVPKNGPRKRVFFDVIEGKYPDVDKVIPDGDPSELDGIAFNPEYIGLIGKAAKALGARVLVVVAKLYSKTKPIKLNIQGIDDQVEVFVMPCRY